jgi:hypothetical protein
MRLTLAASFLRAATAEIRVNRVGDLDSLEQTLGERIKHKPLPEAQVELEFQRGRPPLRPTEASRALAMKRRDNPAPAQASCMPAIANTRRS